MKTELSEIQSAYVIKVKRYEPAQTANGYILALHGFCGSMEGGVIRQLGRRMTKHGIAVVTFDFPGHGSSDADSYFSLENCQKDMLDIMRYANRLYGVSAPRAVFGTSFGGYVTLLNLTKLSQNTDIILRAPAVNMKGTFESFVNDMTSFRNNGSEDMGFERKLKVPYSFYNELEKHNIVDHDFNRKMLIIYGDSDNVVRSDDIRSFSLNNRQSLLKIIKGADHRFKSKENIEELIKAIDGYLFPEEG